MSAEPQSAQTGGRRRNRKPLLIVFSVVLMDLAGFGLVLPILPLYANALGSSPYFIGALLSIYSLMQFLINPLWGRLSDRVGRRPIILMSLTGSVLAYTIYGFAEQVPGGAGAVLLVLFCSRMLAGAMAANIATAQAIVADVTAPEDRARGMGMVGAAIGLGFVIGPALGALFTLEPIREQFGLGVPGLVAAALSLMNLVWAVVALPETLSAENRHRAREKSGAGLWFGLRRRGGLALMVGAMFLITLAFSQFESAFSLLAGLQFELSPSRIGLIFATMGIIMVVMQGGMTRILVRRMGERLVLMAGAAVMGVGMAGVANSQAAVPLFGWLALLAIGFGAAQPALLALISRFSAADEQGLVMGIGQSMASLARIAGPAIGLGLFGGVSMQAPFWAAGVFMFGVVLAALLLRSVPEQNHGTA